MLRTHWIAAAAALLMVGSSAGSGAVTSPQEREAPPGEGVICAWGIYSFVSEVVERCAELKRSVERLDAYVRANSEITPEQFDRFKREQANVGAPESAICQAGVADGLVDSLTRVPVHDLRASIDELVARPGTPTWGTCL